MKTLRQFLAFPFKIIGVVLILTAISAYYIGALIAGDSEVFTNKFKDAEEAMRKLREEKDETDG